MTVERETAGFALPFASGILISAYAGNLLHDSHFTAYIASLTFIAVTSILLISQSRHRISIFSIIFTALCTGLLTGLTDLIMAVSDSDKSVVKPFLSYGYKLQAIIDSVPFRNPQTNAILNALITGERCNISPEITAAFRDSGAAHILSLSGFHLGIIYSIVKAGLSVAGNSRPAKVARSIATVMLCGFYTLATGAGASIVRAFIFILLREAALLSHRAHNTAQLLLTALIIQLTLSPSDIRSVSFQLSYAAMAGIAFIFPWLKSFWPATDKDDSWKLLHRIWESAALSISCQFTTAPLAWIYFHSFPMHFLLTNLIALPLTSIAIPFFLITLLLHSAGVCPQLMLSATEALVSVLIASLEIISSM